MAQKLGQVVFEQNINPAAWMTQAPGKKPKGLKKIEHPVFLEAAKLVMDQYWVERLTEMAGGKFLSGFGMRDGYLQYKHCGKVHAIMIPEGPREAAQITIKFMQEFFVKSQTDRNAEAQRNYQQPMVFQTWKEMSKGMKQHVLCEFVTRTCSGRAQTDECYMLIKRGLGDKRISPEHITCVENRIHSISGLRYEAGSGWYLDPEICPLPRVPTSKVKSAPMTVKYDKGQIPHTYSKLTKYVASLAKKAGGTQPQMQAIDVPDEDDVDEDLE